MQKNIHLTPLDAGFESTMVLHWLVEVGDFVEASQVILEIETQKTVSEVPSSEQGFVRKLCVEQNETIAENTLLCILTDTLDEPLQETGSSTGSQESHVGRETEQADPIPQNGESGIKALPAVRKLARELGVDLAQLRGSGAQGQITADDVRTAASQNGSLASGGSDGWVELPVYRVALNQQMQKSLAEIPQIHIVRQMEVSPLMNKVEGITFTHKLVQKLGLALAEHPALCTMIQGTKVKAEPASVAVAIESANGLVAPVVRNAESLTLTQIAETVRDFRARAESGALRADELNHGPFALTNLGILGVDFFNAFVFHGQTAVLAVGRVSKGDASESRAWFDLAVDHRVVDGAEAARFLATLQTLISNNER